MGKPASGARSWKTSRSTRTLSSREDLLKWNTEEAYRSKVRIIGKTREHPDPRRNQLAMAQLWHDRYSWHILDYMSVYQFYRTSLHQNTSFQYTMMHMHFFCTHERS